MKAAELDELVRSMIIHTDRDGYSQDDIRDNAVDVIDSAKRCGYITEDEADLIVDRIYTVHGDNHE